MGGQGKLNNEVPRAICGCQRGLICCLTGRKLLLAMRGAFNEASIDGSWVSFDRLRTLYEQHFKRPSGTLVILRDE